MPDNGRGDDAASMTEDAGKEDATSDDVSEAGNIYTEESDETVCEAVVDAIDDEQSVVEDSDAEETTFEPRRREWSGWGI